MISYVLSIVFILAIFLVAFKTCSARQPEEEINFDRMIDAIKGAENWDGRSIGAAGELGPMQFRSSTWFDYSSKPFHWALGRTPLAKEELDLASHRHIQRLLHYCSILGKTPTPYLVALLHTAGFGAVRTKTCSAAKKDFAERAANLYHEKP